MSRPTCPLGHRCESCGAEHPDLAVLAVATEVGVLCLTTCARCRIALDAGAEPPITVGTAIRLVDQHTAHEARIALDAVCNGGAS